MFIRQVKQCGFEMWQVQDENGKSYAQFWSEEQAIAWVRSHK